MRGESSRTVLVVFLIAALHAPAGSDAANLSKGLKLPSIVKTWNDVLIDAVRNASALVDAGVAPFNGVNIPPARARMAAILNTCMYDAYVKYDRTAVFSNGTRPTTRCDFSDEDARHDISSAAYVALRNLFGRSGLDLSVFDRILAGLGFDMEEQINSAECEAVLEARTSDGSRQAQDYQDVTCTDGVCTTASGYCPVNTAREVTCPMRWQTLESREPRSVLGCFNGGTQIPFTAFWSAVRGFALDCGSEFRPEDVAPRFDTEDFRLQVNEILWYNANLNDEGKAIAEFWLDATNVPNEQALGAPEPLEWLQFAAVAAKSRSYNLGKELKLTFLVANSLFDASIVAWDAKVAYDYSRPLTGVRALTRDTPVLNYMKGGFLESVPGQEWRPFLPTPPFQAFTSGHSTFAGAAAFVLREFTGSDIFGASVTIPANASVLEPGFPLAPVTLTWPTFSAAAKESGISRLLGGVHWRIDDEEGRLSGAKAGAKVLSKGLTLFSGTSTSSRAAGECRERCTFIRNGCAGCALKYDCRASDVNGFNPRCMISGTEIPPSTPAAFHLTTFAS